ncbi:GNAT family N-acetyltransferase [Lentzea flaviverrucosa]|uniref:Protein N-acetyltransferase, RimJ/RimL family n=1 Tax=Lentzea flaviverrucosa TaxID=200379 RepID=A0A1H9XVG8_9PSEU|nr:GNAT family N-acetyltransferase [Lentzea flaviverrucosa]RDI18675.1 RimJ/RimL family protein N-acetyltransferase [Lentzea flaviverrucosa]SES50111.1 Protein N-acetyltransferase, RimJ/RimL family [Lentzea flaviverrucosa]
MDAWPLRHLVLRTPRLELRPDDDAGLFELVEVAKAGVHDPAEMPFNVPWTDSLADDHGFGMVQFFWGMRAKLAAKDWAICFLVRHEGKVIGVQEVGARDFGVLREVNTGSWLGKEFQGSGFGTEMRVGVLQFAFDHLGAHIARSAAWQGNQASNRVSAKLGYVHDGTIGAAPRGERLEHVRLRLDEADFVRPGWNVAVDGLAECVQLLTS